VAVTISSVAWFRIVNYACACTSFRPSVRSALSFGVLFARRLILHIPVNTDPLPLKDAHKECSKFAGDPEAAHPAV
jgi:hypothetical protein